MTTLLAKFVSGLDVIGVLVYLPSNHESTGSGTLVKDAEARGSAPIVKKNSISTDVPQIIDTARLLSSKVSKFVFVRITTSTCFEGSGNGDSFGAGRDMVAIKKFPDIHQKPSLASAASRSVPEVSETPPSSC